MPRCCHRSARVPEVSWVPIDLVTRNGTGSNVRRALESNSLPVAVLHRCSNMSISCSASLFRLERSSLVLICIVLRSFASTGIARGLGEYHIPLSGATCKGA